MITTKLTGHVVIMLIVVMNISSDRLETMTVEAATIDCRGMIITINPSLMRNTIVIPTPTPRTIISSNSVSKKCTTVLMIQEEAISVTTGTMILLLLGNQIMICGTHNANSSKSIVRLS